MSGKLTTLPFKNRFRFVNRTSLKLFVCMIFFAAVLFVSDINFLPQVFAQQVISKNNKDEPKILSEIKISKNFIETQEWEKARVKLSSIITNFPNNRHLDITYYWLAYTLFQQKKFSEAEQTIADLQSEFSGSAWIDESKSLLAEIKSKNGQQVNLTSEEFSKSDDETKAFAVQNMLETDRRQATAIIDEILGSPSKATDNLKESVLILLFGDRSDWATDKFIQIIKTENNENLVIQSLIGLRRRDEKKILPVLRDFLQQNTNENLYDAALYTVSSFPTETSITTLIYFAKNGKNNKLKQKSIIWLGNLGTKRAIEELRNSYKIFTEIELKQQVQISLSEMNKSESLQTLIDLIESETNNDLIEHGLEMLKRKAQPFVVKYLQKNYRTKIK